MFEEIVTGVEWYQISVRISVTELDFPMLKSNELCFSPKV